VGSLGTDPEKDAGPAEKVRRNLKNIRLLVVDADEQLRLDVHRLLDRHGCLCETASNASEAITMARVSSYNAVIFDIHTREMPGEELFSTLQEIAPSSRLIASIGFGYDPGHSVVKARQKGLKYMLYKPFRADQLLDFLEDLDG
jgi:DNA-binding NtrC family response regulator